MLQWRYAAALLCLDIIIIIIIVIVIIIIIIIIIINLSVVFRAAVIFLKVVAIWLSWLMCHQA